jgi:hypothetical protein
MNTESTTVVEPGHAPPVSGALWFALFAGMIAWAIDEQLSYAITYKACSTGRYWLVDVVTAATVALSVLGIFLGFSGLRGVGLHGPTGSKYADRTRFLAMSAIALDVGFTLLIIATAVPKAMLSPCQ